jgi:hypothetical protein
MGAAEAARYVEASGVSLARRIVISRSRISIRSCIRRRRLGPSFALASILIRLPLSFSAKASFDFRAIREGSGIAEVLWRGGVGVCQERRSRSGKAGPELLEFLAN